MSKKQLNLFKLSASRSAELRVRPATIMRRDAGNASIGRILLEHLPDDLLGHGLALYPVASIHRPEYAAVCQTGSGSPGADRDFHPGRHRHGANAAVLAN